jgi:hypothetical protein
MSIKFAAGTNCPSTVGEEVALIFCSTLELASLKRVTNSPREAQSSGGERLRVPTRRKMFSPEKFKKNVLPCSRELLQTA